MSIKMYHATKVYNLSSIQQHGLLTCPPLVYPSGKVEDGWETGCVWLFDNLLMAIDFGTQDMAVLEVDVTDVEVVSDPHPGWGDDRDNHSFATMTDIPASRLRLVHPTTERTER